MISDALGQHRQPSFLDGSACTARYARGIPDPNTSSKPFSKLAKLSGKEPVLWSYYASTGDLKMITLKLIGLVMGAGILASFASDEFGSDLLLAIFSLFS
jgi:hypothetical protein